MQELLAADFSVTALTRSSSSSTFPDGVKAKKVDYDSVDSLKQAFEGQDAVVSAIATPAVQGQKAIIDAAVGAGVKRFIPSEFGINTRITGGTAIGKILAGKVAIVDYLDEKSKSNSDFSWTGVSTGLFFDWVGHQPSARESRIRLLVLIGNTGPQQHRFGRLREQDGSCGRLR